MESNTDVDHLLTNSGWHHISGQIRSPLEIPCKPTFPQVKIELVGIDSSSVRGCEINSKDTKNLTQIM